MSASPEVAFVCITNHILDAAKSNRCVCLLRPEPDKTELMCIALGVLCQKHSNDAFNVGLITFDEESRTPTEFAGLLCECYLDLIHNKAAFSWFVQFFGLRWVISRLYLLPFLIATSPETLHSIIAQGISFI